MPYYTLPQLYALTTATVSYIHEKDESSRMIWVHPDGIQEPFRYEDDEMGRSHALPPTYDSGLPRPLDD